MNNLLESPSVREALAQVPADDRAAINDAGKCYGKRLDQFNAIRQRSGEIRRRLAAISETLPDARSGERTELLKERQALAVEREFLPADTRVVARLFTEALMDLSRAILAGVAHGTAEARAGLAATDDQYNGAIRRLHAAPYGTKQHDEQRHVVGIIEIEREPFLKRATALRTLEEATTEYLRDAFEPVGSVNVGKLLRQPAFVAPAVDAFAAHYERAA